MLRVLNGKVLSPQISPQAYSVTSFCIGRLKSSAFAQDFSTWPAPSTSLRFMKPCSKRSLFSIACFLSWCVDIVSSIVPAGSVVAVADHGLRFQIFPKARLAPFTSIAGLLVAAEWRGEIRGGVVQVDTARAQRTPDFSCARQAARLHVGRETVVRAIGNLDSLGFRVIGHDRQHGAEDFLAVDGHAGRDVGKNGRLDKEALLQPLRTPGASRDKPRPFVDTSLDQCLHAVELVTIDKRAKLRRVRIGR